LSSGEKLLTAGAAIAICALRRSCGSQGLACRTDVTGNDHIPLAGGQREVAREAERNAALAEKSRRPVEHQ